MRTLLWAASLASLVALGGGTPDGERMREPSGARLKGQQLLRRRSRDCGGNFDFNAGDCVEIYSPGFPMKYKRNARCLWRFAANPPATTITMCCSVFHLQKSCNCKKDNVILKDGGNNTVKLLWEEKAPVLAERHGPPWGLLQVELLPAICWLRVNRLRFRSSSCYGT
ncbi:cubilin-like [Penaeus chinensis]|uniref:cubilin-like n=1 Tax=Penaeus chinensis TaxID=139456 RepID=UPI001FB64941|nr:cubilin-like [Penaeus chinensis]